MKVNLLKSKVKSEDLSAKTVSFGNTKVDTAISFKESVLDSGENKGILTNILLLSIFTIGAYYYSGFADKKISKEKQKVSQQITKIEKQIQDKEKVVKEYSKFKTDSNEFERKITALKELSKSRLIELKALDYMQNIVPEKLWFTSIKYSKNSFLIKGKSSENTGLSEFLKELETSPFFVDILILKAKEVKDKTGSVIDFEIQSGLKVI